jgi:hypothetical protein
MNSCARLGTRERNEGRRRNDAAARRAEGDHRTRQGIISIARPFDAHLINCVAHTTSMAIYRRRAGRDCRDAGSRVVGA